MIGEILRLSSGMIFDADTVETQKGTQLIFRASLFSSGSNVGPVGNGYYRNASGLTTLNLQADDVRNIGANGGCSV